MIVSTLGYVRRDGKTLMLHRNKRDSDFHKGKFNGLGGKLEQGENPEACMMREIHEESGLTVKDMRLRGVITFPLFDGVDDWLTFVYEITDFEGEPVDCDEGSLHWIADEAIMTLNLWEGDPVFLDWIYNGQAFFSATFIYRNKQYISHEVKKYTY